MKNQLNASIRDHISKSFGRIGDNHASGVFQKSPSVKVIEGRGKD